MNAALVTIGDEILAGDTVNTNAAWLGQQLAAQGTTVERMTVVPDRVAEIARVVNEYQAEYDAVVVTGGLGPTHDDRTMEAVAAAFGTTLEHDESVLQWLVEEKGYPEDDLAPGTTQIPARAEMLRNPVGVAPGCVIGNVYVLPGLPTEMQAMFELIRDEFGGEARFVEVVRTSEGESSLLERVETLQEEFDVTVGSYPGENVRLKVSGTDEAEVAAAVEWLESRVAAPDE